METLLLSTDTAMGNPAPLVISAHAKVNLSLEVLGARPDGYHSLVSVMQRISLCDTLEAGEAVDISFTCSDARLGGNDNLVVRAAALLRERYGVTTGCRLRLVKRIPVAAGLGGGSADAAAAIEILSRLWDLRLTQEEMETVGAALGSDVPFCLRGGTALVEGRGERVTSLPDPAPTWYLLVNPGVAVSTARIFAAVQRSDWSDGTRTRDIALTIERGGLSHLGVNALERALFELHPESWACFERVEALATGRTRITGSGATVVSWHADERSAERDAEVLRAMGYWCSIARSVHREDAR